MKPVHNSQRRSDLIEEVDDDEDVYMNGVNIAA
jgi:hypothetical protein